MNGKSQENADYGDFNFKKDDVPTMFAPTNQEANSQMPAAAMPFATNKGTVTTPGTLQGAKIPPYYTGNTPIHGFADAGQGSAWRYANPQLSAVSYAPGMNPVPPGIENQPPAYQQQFVNPYADYWAQMQQAGGAPPRYSEGCQCFSESFSEWKPVSPARWHDNSAWIYPQCTSNAHSIHESKNSEEKGC